jgi:hypothetical protein
VKISLPPLATILPSRTASSMGIVYGFSYGIVPGRNGTELYLLFITKVNPYLIFLDSNIIIIVYNVCAPDSDNRVSEWIHEAEKHAPSHALKVLVGNKLDLIEGKVCRPLDEEAWKLVKENKIHVYETSCKSGVGI